MTVVIKPTALTVNDCQIAEAPRLDTVLETFGRTPCREVILEDQGKPWRKFVIFDELGVYALYDYEIERVIDLHFCFANTKSPSTPTGIYSGLIFINGVRLVAGMKEKLLPTDGEFRFLKEGGWVATNDTFFIHIRTSGSAKALVAIDVSFLQHPPFKGK